MKRWLQQGSVAAFAVVAWLGMSGGAWASSVSLVAKQIDGKVYVSADSLQGSLGGSGSYDAASGTYSYSTDSGIPAVVERTTPSVVAVIGRPNATDQSGRQADRFDLAHGTGVIVSADGQIITNAHVVKDMKNIYVVTSSGKQYAGKVKSIDESSDLALVKIEAAGLQPASFAAKGSVKVGDTVVAIGTPLSFALRNTATVGVVSGLERSVDSTYWLLQTDAAINPGNSGGPLVNLKGEVVGINSMKFVDFGVDSLGFAIPSDTVQYVMKQFAAYGKVKHPYLGIELEESWEAVVGLPTEEALRVASVDPDSSAAKNGVKQGDVLISIDGNAVRTIVEINELFKAYLPGQTVHLQFKTGTGTVTRDAVLTELKTNEEKPVSSDSGGDAGIDEDLGKTKIGDSHSGWSMKYPTGLAKSYQSENGNTVMFGDAKGEFTLQVAVDEEKAKRVSSLKSLLQSLSDYTEGSVLDKQVVTAAEPAYARVLVRNQHGSYEETRGFLSNGKAFVISLSVGREADYKNGAKNKAYRDLLDSFVLSFDASDKTLKDIAVIKGDSRKITLTEYGLSFSLPAGWKDGSFGGQLFYRNTESKENMAVNVSSLSDGDSLEQWAARHGKQFEDSYAADFRKPVAQTTSKAAGQPAVLSTYSYTMGDDWHTAYVLYVVKGGYKYQFSIMFDDKDITAAKVREQFESIIGSIAVNLDEANANLGFIQDEDELQADTTQPLENKKNRYTLDIPATWYDSSYGDAAENEILFDGGTMRINTEENGKLADAIKREEDYHKKSAEADSDFKVLSSADVTLGGQAAKKYVIAYVAKKIPFTETTYVAANDGYVYTLKLKINDAVNTEKLNKQVEDVLNSFRFIK